MSSKSERALMARAALPALLLAGASGAAMAQTPVGAQIGQSYNAFAVRSQFAF